MREPHKHCHYCGEPYDSSRVQQWPRTCGACHETAWMNPKPVVVVPVKIVGGGLLTVRRNIEPEKGKFAFAGGYIDHGETWQQAAARELREETSGLVQLVPEDFSFLGVATASNKNVLIFAVPKNVILSVDVSKFEPNPEVSELKILRAPAPLAWSTHTQFAHAYFVGNMQWPKFE